VILMKADKDNIKLVKQFGARLVSKIKGLPKFQTFESGLMYSHRDFDKYLKHLKKGDKCAIVSGLNPSGPLHMGHLGVFLTNLFFQKKYGVDVFIPISDDESYLTGKIKDQEAALKNSFILAKQLLALGFNPKKTFFIIDQLCTPIYNLAIKFSRTITRSVVKATYGYTGEDNIGLQFYPAVQAAHINFPLTKGYKAVLVPIAADEDAHIRISRDTAGKFGLEKPAALHSVFMPGLDGTKMSKSRPHASIFLNDDLNIIKKKINRAVSGGQKGIELHRKLGGNPEIDISYQYLNALFLDRKQSAKIYKDYKSGKILSGEMKQMLYTRVIKLLGPMHKKFAKITNRDIKKCLLKF
jgi:tryptophanyl-tRNA synthetase